jgi:hypothetical protein
MMKSSSIIPLKDGSIRCFKQPSEDPHNNEVMKMLALLIAESVSESKFDPASAGALNVDGDRCTHHQTPRKPEFHGIVATQESDFPLEI